MATEVYRGDLIIEAKEVEDVIKQLQGLNKVAEQLKASLGNIKIDAKAVDTSALTKSLQDIAKQFEQAGRKFQESLSGAKVNFDQPIKSARESASVFIEAQRNIRSEFTLTQQAIQSQLATLPDKTAPAAVAIKAQFASIKQAMQEGFYATPITKAFQDLSKEIEVVKISQLKAAQQAQTAQAELRDAYAQTGKSARESAQVFIQDNREQLKLEQQIKTAQAELRDAYAQTGKSAKASADVFIQAQQHLVNQAKQELAPALQQLQAQLASLPQKATPEYFLFQNRLKLLKQEINSLSTETGITGLKENFGELSRAIALATAEQGKLKEATKQTSLAGMVQDFNAIQAGAEKAFVPVHERLRGLGLLFTTSGARLQGLREALVGTGASTNIFVRGIDALVRRGSDLDQLNGRLSKGIADISRQTAQANIAMSNQTEQLRKLIVEETGSQKASNQLAQQLKAVEAAFNQVTTTARRGGDIEPAMARAKTAAENVEFAFKSLVESGILPANSQAKALAEQMLAGTKNNLSSLQAMAVRYRATKEEIKQVKEQQKGQNAEVEKGVSIFGRLRNALASLLGISRNNQSAIKGMGDSLRQVDREVNVVAASATKLKDIFLGVFGGTFLSGLIFRLSDAIRGIGDEFFTLNDLVQNTEITIKGMLEGSDVNAQEAIAGFQAFIKDEVARTPFEIADATSAALRLIQQGFDPQDWFRASANAAAAMNKPMEQFIGGLTKLMAGSRGIAVDMFRDFGLNVQNISGVFDKATGRALTFEETQAALKLSTEDFNREYTKLGFEFDKQGSLVNDTGEALDILNAYLLQNATFANAAASRSLSLTGVMSNFKDSLSNVLIAIGQPIFEKLTFGAQGFLSKLQDLQPTLEYFGAQIGQRISQAIDFAVNAFTNFQSTIATFTQPLQAFSSLIQSVFYGDWNQAWNDALTIVVDVLNAIVSNLDNFAIAAFDWGFSFVVQITNGIIDAANSILMDAINSITEMISSFLAPGSPPEQGPLSTIDTWGKDLMDTFLSSMSSADINFVTKALEPVAERFEKFADREEGLVPFQNVRNGLVGLVSQLDETGQINEEVFAQIRDTILAAGDDTEAGQAQELVDNLRQQLELRQRLRASQEGLREVNQEILEAEAAGFIPAELIQKKNLLEEQAQVVEDQVTEEEQKQQALENLYGLDSKVFEEETKGRVNAARAAGAAMAGAASRAAQRSLQSWRDSYAQELAALEAKKAAGIITEEEYLKELLKLKENYVDKALEEGVASAELQQTYDQIKEIQSRLEEFSSRGQAANESIRKAFTPPSVQDIMAGFIQQTQDTLADAGVGGGESFVAAIKTETISRLGTATEELKQNFKTSFRGIVDAIRENLTPENFVVISTLTGLLLKLGGAPIVGGLTKLAGMFGLVGGGIGGLVVSLARFSIIGGIVTLIIYNWDTIVAAAEAAWQGLNNVIDTFVQKAGGVQAVTDALTGLINEGTRIATELGQNFTRTLTQFINGELSFTEAIDKLIAGFTIIDWGPIKAHFDTLWQPLKETANQVVIDIGNYFLNLIPPDIRESIKATLDSLKAALVSFFAAGELGRELLELWNQLVEAFVSDEAANGVGALGIAIGILVGGALDVLISAVQGVVAALPQLVDALGGVVNVIDGVITILQAMAEGLISLGTFIYGFVTGDVALMDDGAQGLKNAFNTYVEGIGELFTGLLDTVTNTGAAIITAVTNFATSLVSNFALVTGNTELYDAVTKWQADFNTGFDNILTQVGTTLDQLETILSTGTEGIKLIFSGIFEAIKTDIAGDLAGIIAQITQFGQDVVAKFDEYLAQASETVSGVVEAIKQFFTNLYMDLVGGSIIPEMMIGIIAEFARLPGEAVNHVIQMVTDILAEFVSLSDDILGLIPTIISNVAGGFLDLGKSVVGNIIDGIQSGISGIGSAISGLFGGGQEEQTTSFDPAQVQGALDALRSEMGTFQSGASVLFGTLLVDWRTNVTQMGVEWTTFITNTKLLLDNFYQTFDIVNINSALSWATFITAITMAWTTFKTALSLDITTLQTQFSTTLMLVQAQWQTALTMMLELAKATSAELLAIIEAIKTGILEALDVIINKINSEVNPAFVSIGETADSMSSRVENSVDNVVDLLDDLRDAIEEVSSAFEEMASNARDAASAAMGALTTGGGSMPSAALGAERTHMGLWQLHEDEMVLPKYIADPMREIFKKLSSTGIGNSTFAIDPNLLANPARQQVVEPVQPQTGGVAQTNNFYTTINDQMDEQLFQQKVLRTVARAIR